MTSPTHIANVNPFRYRGYYYDTESGFYYLQSRYYDPTTGRFINADGQINTDSLLGTNLFAYCENNPVNMCDPNGHIGIMTVCFIIGVTALAIDLLSGGAQERTDAMLEDPSFYNIANWATAGMAKYIKGTFAPEEPLSLEHWMDSFFTATLFISAISRIPVGQVAPKTPVIGKMRDLNAPGAIGKNEFKVADLLPDMGDPKLNWKQNSSVLRKIMSSGRPIRDASVYPMQNAGFLGAERMLLSNHGWNYADGYWIKYFD